MKFQAIYLSWESVSQNLGTVNEVLQSTGAHHAASAATKGTTGPAGVSVANSSSAMRNNRNGQDR